MSQEMPTAWKRSSESPHTQNREIDLKTLFDQHIAVCEKEVSIILLECMKEVSALSSQHTKQDTYDYRFVKAIDSPDTFPFLLSLQEAKEQLAKDDQTIISAEELFPHFPTVWGYSENCSFMEQHNDWLEKRIQTKRHISDDLAVSNLTKIDGSAFDICELEEFCIRDTRYLMEPLMSWMRTRVAKNNPPAIHNISQMAARITTDDGLLCKTREFLNQMPEASLSGFAKRMQERKQFLQEHQQKASGTEKTAESNVVNLTF